MKKYIFTVVAALMLGLAAINPVALAGPPEGSGGAPAKDPIVVYGPPEGTGG